MVAHWWASVYHPTTLPPMETVVLETTAPWDGHPDCWRKSSLVNWQLLNQKETILERTGENQFTKWNLFEGILKIQNLSWLSTELPTFLVKPLWSHPGWTHAFSHESNRQEFWRDAGGFTLVGSNVIRSNFGTIFQPETCNPSRKTNIPIEIQEKKTFNGILLLW